MQTIEINDLASAVMNELEEYAKYTTECVKDAVKETGTIVRDEIRSNAPKDSGDYSKSWTVKVLESSHGSKAIIYSRNRYQLTHLLEYGHAKRGGGRVQPKPHISKAEQVGEQTLSRILERRFDYG